MAYTPSPFQYALKAYDALDLSVETADLLAVRDVQLQNYLQTETASIQSELGLMLPATALRYGSEVITLGAAAGNTIINYATAFSSSYNAVVVIVSNGGRAANTATFSTDPISSELTRFELYWDGGQVGGARVNYIAIAYV